MRKKYPEKNFFQIYQIILWGNVQLNKSTTVSRDPTGSLRFGPQRISTVRTLSVTSGDQLIEIMEKVETGLSNDEFEEVSNSSIQPETISQEGNRIEI
jgi:hypothetical protein